jgi:YfiH family protein
LIRKKVGEIQWLEFEIFAEEPTLVHGVFLRHGGVSSGPYATLNLGKDIGDFTENVLENRRRVLSALNVPACVSCHQVHGNEVKLVTDPSQNIGECDGITTQQTDLALLIKHADCQAAIIYDPIHRALANVHAGWRGNVKNIYRAAVQKMVQSFGSKPENLLVGISPSIGPKNAEFKNYKLELPEEFWDFQVKPTYFDLWQIARHQFEESGVLSHHIQIAEICTVDHPADYFSYRRDKTTGRHATVAMLSVRNKK